MNDITHTVQRELFTLGGLRSTFLYATAPTTLGNANGSEGYLWTNVVAELLELCAPDSSSDSTSTSAPPTEFSLVPRLRAPPGVRGWGLRTRLRYTFVHVNYSRIMLGDRKSLLFLKLCPHNKRRPTVQFAFAISCTLAKDLAAFCLQSRVRADEKLTISWADHQNIKSTPQNEYSSTVASYVASTQVCR